MRRKKDRLWCDNDCGRVGTEPVTHLVVPVETANAGESAILCLKCFRDYMKRAAEVQKSKSAVTVIALVALVLLASGAFAQSTVPTTGNYNRQYVERDQWQSDRWNVKDSPYGPTRGYIRQDPYQSDRYNAYGGNGPSTYHNRTGEVLKRDTWNSERYNSYGGSRGGGRGGRGR